MVLFKTTVCGIEELGDHCAAGVSHVLSILDPGWPVPPAFRRFGRHRRLELRFHDVIVEDGASVAPRPEDLDRLLDFGRGLVAEAPACTHLLVHCHAGVSRSTAAMALLIAQAAPAMCATDVFGQVLAIRPCAWPNLRMVEMGDAILGRQGELVRAAHRLYRGQLRIRPELQAAYRSSGRAREVDAALNSDAEADG
jgi:predicted protein tyrosine phosphatase